MKKIIAILLSLIMVMGLFAACGNNGSTDIEGSNENKGNTTTAPQATDPTPSETDPEPTDAQLTTVTPGKLTMATNAFFPPYEFYEGDKIVGIDAEIAEAIATKLGLELLLIYIIVTVVRNYVEPKIVGTQLGLHPIITLIAMFIGMRLFGFVGVFGLPVAVSFLWKQRQEKLQSEEESVPL